MTFAHACGKLQWLSEDINPESYYQLSFWAKIIGRTSLLCPKKERQLSVNNFSLCITQNASALWRH